MIDLQKIKKWLKYYLQILFTNIKILFKFVKLLKNKRTLEVWWQGWTQNKHSQDFHWGPLLRDKGVEEPPYANLEGFGSFIGEKLFKFVNETKF